jgi:hypothetical protein
MDLLAAISITQKHAWQSLTKFGKNGIKRHVLSFSTKE